MRKLLLVFFTCLVITSCSTNNSDNGEAQWDFDHNVRFQQTKIDEQNYRIVVIPNVKTRFNKLATFLLRRSMDICQSYGFKICLLYTSDAADE